VIVARCRDVTRERFTRWLLVTPWGSFHLPPTFRRSRRQPSRHLLEALEEIVYHHSPEWEAAYFARLRWYAEHDGDMTGAPELPEN
jgi:hypothetical protein